MTISFCYTKLPQTGAQPEGGSYKALFSLSLEGLRTSTTGRFYEKDRFFMLIYFISNSVVFSAQEVEIYTIGNLPPFAFIDKQGELTGVYVEIVRKAVSEMPDYTVSFKVVPWIRAKKKAERGAV